jgi:hypothetical protein
MLDAAEHLFNGHAQHRLVDHPQNEDAFYAVSLLLPNGKWPEDVFGWVVRLEYSQKGNLKAKVKDENLMPGDATNPPPQPST